MKKIIRSIALLIAISLLGITDTYAYSVGDEFTKGIRDLGVWPLKFDTGADYGDNLYTGQKTGENKIHNIYCLDPGARDGRNLIVERVLMADGSPKAEDYGMIKILTADISDTSVNPHGLSEDHFSFARSVAIRTFINGYLHWANGASTDNRVEAFEKTSDFWTTGKGESGIIAKNTLGEQIMESAELLFQLGREARNNYKDAALPSVEVELVSAKEVRDQDADSDMSIPTPVEPVDPDAPVTITKNLEYIVKFKIDNFSEDAKFIWLAETDNRDSIDIEYDYEVVGLGYENTGSVDDLRTVGLWDNREIWQYLKGQATQDGDLYDVTFYVGIKVTATTTEEQLLEEGVDCAGVIDLRYKYEDPNLFHGVVLYGRNAQGVSVTNEQRFVFGTHEPVEDKYPVSFNGCGFIACDPVGMLPQVCEDGLEADENGNVEYVYRESFVTADGLTGAYNIRKCVLKNPTDVAGNSLKLRDNADAKRVSNNPYCSILCKEDYRFVVPYKRQVTPGRYFQIETSLKGQQECYSDEFNYEQYILDLREAIEALVEEVNNWGMWHELSENGLGGTCEHEDSCVIIDCELGECESPEGGPPCTPPCESEDADCPSQTREKVVFDQNADYYQMNAGDPTDLRVYDASYYDVLGYHYDFGKIDPENPGSYGYCDSECSETDEECCEFITPQDDYDSQVPDFESDRSTSAAKIETLVQEIKKIIDTYNFCTGDDNYEEYAEAFKNGDNSWEMIYDFHPRISYSYDEPDPTKTDGTGEAKWISQVQSFTCEEGTCDYMHIKEIEINAEDCTGLDDCNEVDKVESIHPTVEGGDEYEELNVNEYCIDDINNDYTCVGQTLTTIDESSYEEKMYWVCDASDETNVTCQEEPFDLTKIKFVHKTAVASATLDTPRVYYSGHDDGNIMISTGRAPDNFTKVDGLPVSVNTPENTYPYILGFEDIGKFYSEDKLGRIYGVSDQSLAKWNKDNLSTNIFSDTKTSVTITTGEGSAREVEIEANKYACTYELFNSCVDSDGVRHTSDECRYGEDEPDWNACKERLCPTSEDSGYCVQQAEAYYVCKNQFYKEDECTPYDTRAEALAITGPENNYNCCPNCTIECVGSCLYVLHNDYVNDGELLVDFRPISTSNINPNNRTIGYNWQTVNASNRLMSIKAGLTISEIEERARKGADVNDPDFEIIDDYTLKVKMTPEMITYIKEYNNEQIDEGSYNNNTLECDDYDLNNIYSTEDDCTDAGYNWHDDKCVMANIFCYSTFIDELIAEFNQGGEVLVDAPGREAAKDAAWRNYTVASSTQIPGEVEDIVTNNYWTIYQFTELDINNDGRPDVGPSWK